jgi:hypothetical protein
VLANETLKQPDRLAYAVEGAGIRDDAARSKPRSSSLPNRNADMEKTSVPRPPNWIRRVARDMLTRLAEGFWWPPLALIVVAVYWFSTASGIPLPSEATVEKHGPYGDSFGRLTSLFTALGFGGLIITLLLQQRQIQKHEEAARGQRHKDERARYEDVLFRLLDIYRQTLTEVQIGDARGRDVIRRAVERVDAALLEDGVNALPRALHGKWDRGAIGEADRPVVDYVHYRNFKIVSVEIHPQARLVDTFEVLLEHMCRGAPEHLLINAYKDIVFAQLTFIECRYFFLVALSQTNRTRLRDLIARTGFLDRVSRSQTHHLHRVMYEEYWGQRIEQRDLPPSIPMSAERIKHAVRAYRKAGGNATTKYTPVGVRRAQHAARPGAESNPKEPDRR